METLLWSIGTADSVDILGKLWRPFLVSLVFYYSSYLTIWISALARVARVAPAFRPLSLAESVDILVVIPTMLKTEADLEGLRDAASTVLGNGYPGRVVLCMAIDGAGDKPALVDKLEAWTKTQARSDATILVARQVKRGGKNVAVHAAFDRVKRAVDDGVIDSVPIVFFNMDGDGVLGPRALERMVAKLVRPGWLFRQRPMIVASNVLVRREHYWSGWRALFTIKGQLALQVAREYMTSISLGRNNLSIQPVTGVSGALYATWTYLHEAQPKHAAFVKSLRRRDVLRWWLGAQPPSFAAFAGTPNRAATTGPGDDTFAAWIALTARWNNGTIDLELPRTPLHALARFVRSFLVRRIAYDPHARVYTATPSTIRGLFKQRTRWNSSRVWLYARFGRLHAFHWELGGWVTIELVLKVWIHSFVFIALFLWPFADRPSLWLSMLAIGYVASTTLRGGATMLAMIQDHDVRGHWHKLLALPVSGIYHFVFNTITTIVGVGKDLVLFGNNTGFAPEETLTAAGTPRLALAYRVTRCAKLAWRALRHGDVPPGRFWLGFGATPWTASGYAGWTNKHNAIGRGGVLPRRAARTLDQPLT
jgi:hypothetical protein